MQIFDLPKELPAPTPDYRNYDPVKEREAEAAHVAALKDHLIALGYSRPNTGRILRMPIADGYAQYMFADGGRCWGLVHLPYGDAWDSPDVRFLPKREVLTRLDHQDRIAEMFAGK